MQKQVPQKGGKVCVEKKKSLTAPGREENNPQLFIGGKAD